VDDAMITMAHNTLRLTPVGVPCWAMKLRTIDTPSGV
jgi:hypothetical protein